MNKLDNDFVRMLMVSDIFVTTPLEREVWASELPLGKNINTRVHVFYEDVEYLFERGLVTLRFEVNPVGELGVVVHGLLDPRLIGERDVR